jgi:uroporphyrin-III C-methyltransferase
MGTAHRDEVVDALIRAGWRGSTPAAVIRNASLPEQTVWAGPLDALPDMPDDAAPGTIVIGNVVALRDGLTRAWPVGQEISRA